MPLWKQQSPDLLPVNGSSSPTRTETAPPISEAMPRMRPSTTPDHAVLTRGITVRGDLTGSDALFLDCLVEGIITIPNERVTIGPNGRVHAPGGHTKPCITAREVVVMGQVVGGIYAEQKLEIRANGSVTGDISTVRVSIEDGAFFRGGIDIRNSRQPEPEPDKVVEQEDLAAAAV